MSGHFASPELKPMANTTHSSAGIAWRRSRRAPEPARASGLAAPLFLIFPSPAVRLPVLLLSEFRSANYQSFTPGSRVRRSQGRTDRDHKGKGARHETHRLRGNFVPLRRASRSSVPSLAAAEPSRSAASDDDHRPASIEGRNTLIAQRLRASPLSGFERC